jgi:hypothetical protein
LTQPLPPLLAALVHQVKDIVAEMLLVVQEALEVAVDHLLLVEILQQTQMVPGAQGLHHLFRVHQ